MKTIVKAVLLFVVLWANAWAGGCGDPRATQGSI
jgi:hypothetical protein